MHPGMADAAERDEVLRVVVRGVVVDVVDVEVLLSATDSTRAPVAFKHGVPNLLPRGKAILVPCPDGDLEPFAVDEGRPPHGKRAPAAESAKTVPGGIVSAERRI